MKEKPGMIKMYLLYFLLFIVISLINLLSVNYIDGRLAIAAGSVWMFLTVIIYMLYLRKSRNRYSIIIYAIFNALISGITSSAYYSLKKVTPYRVELMILVFAGLLLANLALSLLIRKGLVFPIINLAVSIILLCAAGYIWGAKDKSLGSSLFFMLTVYLCFAIAQLLVEKYQKAWINLISLSSLIMFGGILLVVLVAISEGDALELLELVPDVAGSRKGRSKLAG